MNAVFKMFVQFLDIFQHTTDLKTVFLYTSIIWGLI